MKNETKWFRTWKRMVMIMLASTLVACGDSEGFISYGDGEAPEAPTSGRRPVTDGKADGVDDTTGDDGSGDTTGGDTGGDDMSEIPVSSTTLVFEGEGMDADIVFESTSEVSASFGQGAVTTIHNAQHGGVLLTWDGDATDVFVRPAAQFAGDWEPLLMDPTDGFTHRGNAWFPGSHDSYQLYIADPAAIDFLIIEPIPAR